MPLLAAAKIHYTKMEKVTLHSCGRLTQPGWMPGAHESCSVTPLISWAGEKNKIKCLWVEIRAGGNNLAVMGTTDLTQGNYFYLSLLKTD